MKVYFVLLAVLYLAIVLMDSVILYGFITGSSIHYLKAVKALLDVVLLFIALAGAFNQAFQKRYWFERQTWSLMYKLIMALGGFAVILAGYGSSLGVPSPAGKPGLVDMFLIFLPYLLFSVPLILLVNDWKKQESAAK